MVHGTDEIAIEEVFKMSCISEKPRIAQIRIDPNKCSSLLKDLRTLGLNQLALFPEPDSVSKDLMRIYNVDAV